MWLYLQNETIFFTHKLKSSSTLSPSMDIMVSSNFERLLFDLHGRNGAAVAELMATFKQTGGFSILFIF